MNNSTKRIHRIIYIILGSLGIISMVIAAIWGISVYAQNLEKGIKENKEDNVRQDTVIVSIESNVAYLVERARMKEIIDSLLLEPELLAEAQDIMDNNVGTDTFSTDSIGN